MARRKKKTVLTKTLQKIYYDPKEVGSYGGIVALWRAAEKKLKRKIDKTKVEKWLSAQDAYTLHRPARWNFKRRPIVVGGILHQVQADLVQLDRLEKYNDGRCYVLTLVDCFSKFAWARALRDKTGKTLVSAFENIFADGPLPQAIQTDRGTEFLNRNFQRFLKERGIHFFTTQDDRTKCAIVERFNRTLKSKMFRYFTRNDTLTYVDRLPQFLKSYNASHHRSIGMAPQAVNPQNEQEVWYNLYGRNVPIKTKTFVVGDNVRISKSKRQFEKGYLPNFTREIFRIHAIYKDHPTVYTLIDALDEVIEGRFYGFELQRVEDDVNRLYKIDDVVDKRGRGRNQEVLVSWAGYTDKFNSWIPKSDLMRYKT